MRQLAAPTRRPGGWRLLLAVLTLLGGGCAAWDPHAEPAPDEAASWASRLRSPTPPGQMSGIDGRAREIERNLGVR